MHKKWIQSALLVGLGLAISTIPGQPVASEHAASAALPLTAIEQPIIEIPLSGPLADREAEISGLAWYGDYLIILPQYPERLGNHIYALNRRYITLFLEGAIAGGAFEFEAIPFVAPDFANDIEGFEGFEAIAFRGNQAFLTIEAESGGTARGYVVRGTLAEDLSQLTLNTAQIAESPAQSGSPNKADEALLLTENRVVSIYEANGVQLNPTPAMHTFDFELRPQGTVAFPNIEYRITDATALDERDRFWAINYFYEGDHDLIPARDPLAIRYGSGETHRQQQTVERLVEFAYSDNGITRTNTAPIQLQLTTAGRNWEGIVRMDENRHQLDGFLIVTDKFPETILGFVPMPENVSP